MVTFEGGKVTFEGEGVTFEGEEATPEDVRMYHMPPKFQR